jgi:SPP1 gp7 family putative phage head morphogenesis protein
VADPVKQLQRQAAQQRIQQREFSGRSVDAALKKTTRQPKRLEIGYQAFLVSAQRQINKEIAKHTPALLQLIPERTDAPSDDVRRAFDLLRETLARLLTTTGGALVIGIQNYGDKTATFNDLKYDSEVMRLIGIGDVTANIEAEILSDWVTANVDLITRLNEEQIGKLQSLFLRSLHSGSRPAQIETEIRKITKGSVNRARLIARDQIGKLNGQLDRQKQTGAGVDSYVWRGALDARERPEHVAREGLVFSWADPPEDGHPGHPVACRCSAEPHLAGILGKDFSPDPRSAADFSETTKEKRAELRKRLAKRRKRRKARAAQAVG